VSGEVALSVADARVAAVDADGTVRPRGDGETAVVARLRGRMVRVPVQVRGMAKAGPPRFLTDVLPVLTKAGCNQGACHGAASGKGGFKLSLLGYDPDADYLAITHVARSRRVTPSQPERSLILRKPTLQVAHRGGKRFDIDSPEYRLLCDWIAGGLPAPASTEPRVVRLEVVPAVRTLAPGETQRFLVRAHYNDGSQRDATGQTLFTASDESVTSVDPNGTAKPVSPGEGAVVIRYQGLVATARIVLPFGPPRRSGSQAPRPGSHSSPTPNPQSPTPGSPIDALVQAKLDALGLEPSGRCSDAEFIRRATLDVIGLLPAPAEVRAFVGSRDPQKREKLIDALLERPEYNDFWALKWGDILRNSRRSLTEKGMYAFYRWIRESVAENKPWDRFARELLLARGSGFDDGPANYYRIASKPEDLAETTSQVFLGVRVQCARCHNHPYERWTQQQYYQLAAFFARVKLKDGDRPEERDVYLASTGEVKHPRTGKEMVPTALDAAPLPADFHGDRRRALAEWLTSPQNPYFGHVIVNRIWRHFMGRGLVEPVDDLRATNPPTNEALFDWLAQDLAQHGYDLKHVMREIMNSQTYQRSSQPTAANERDTRYFSHYPFKRLGAEQLMDAITAATGVPEKFNGLPLGTRAEQLPDSAVPSYFLELFGRPARQIACECERSSDPTVAQVLHLMNNAGINEKLASKDGRVATLQAAKLSPRQIVDELYLAALSRYPSFDESRTAQRALSAGSDKQRAAEDLLWALLNSKEFLFNH
jgi:mono/diheme cytochrome c family protein